MLLRHRKKMYYRRLTLTGTEAGLKAAAHGIAVLVVFTDWREMVDWRKGEIGVLGRMYSACSKGNSM